MKKMVLFLSALLMVFHLSAQSFKTSSLNDSPNATFLETSNDESESTVTVTLSSDLFVNEDGELTVDITLSEDSNDFEAGDLTFSSASLVSFSGSGSVYQAVIKPWSLDLNWDSIGGDAAITVLAGTLTGASSGFSNYRADLLFRTVLFNDTYWSRGTPEVTLGQNRGSINPVKVYFVWKYPKSGLRESKLGFNASDATVTNGYISKVSSTGNGYEITVVPTHPGELRITVEGGHLDNVNYSNVLGGTFYWNNTAPGVEITTDAPDLTNQPFTATFNFSESISGFSISDITVSNASLSNLSGSGDTYTVDVTPTATGEVTLQLGEATVTDNNGNGNFASEEVSVSYDAEAPSVNINAATAVNGTFTANVTFDEEVTGFELSDISITNATAANFTGSGANYTVDITPAGSGDITIGIAAAAAQDAAGNESTAASQVTVIADVAAPGVVISADALVNGAFSTAITFSEEVAGFELSDIVVGNGTASNLLGSGANYTADITPTTDGDVTINIAADIAQDIAGNNNTAADEVTVSADLTNPGVSISADALVNGVFTAIITFDESVSGFELGDIVLTNGSANNFSGSDDTYTVDITPTTDGDVTIDIAALAAQDAAGNGNTAASQVTVEADLTAPGVSISAATVVNSAFTATITFDESVSGFELADIVLVNGTASNFSGADDTYTVDITPAADGNVTIDIPAAASQDAAGNNTTAAGQVTVLADFTAPEVVVSTNTRANGVFTATITFSEEVTGFELSDINVGNGTASNLLGAGANYTADITPDGSDDVSIDIGANIAQDAAGNDNNAADQVTVMIDLVAPGVSVSADALVNGVFTANITFEEPVSGLELGDISLSNATASNLSGSDAVYTVDITPVTDGDVTIDIAAAVAQDIAGNGNTVASQVTVEADLTVPTATITADSYVFNDFSVTVTFDESVSGFDATDIAIANGNISNFSGSGDSYTFDVELISEGEITIDIAAGAATDAATNENPAAQKVINYDATQPTVTITADDHVNSVFTASITFSESVSGFELADLVVTNATTANLLGSGTDYTVDVTPIAEGAITLDIATGVAADAAGNDNTAATQKVSEADFTAPTARIVAVQDLAWNNSEQNASVTFSEDVLGFTAEDVIITNGNLVSMTYKSHLGLYFLTIQPTAEGVLTIDVAADVATDEAGNGNLVVEQKAIPIDFTSPVVTISSPEGTASKLDVIPISFNAAEDIYVDYPEDIVVTNGVLTHDDEYENFFLEPAGEGTITMTVPVHAISDDALNELTAPLSFSIESDQTAPTFTFDALGNTYWEEGSNSLEIEFSEAITGLTAEDFTVSNGTLDALTAGTGNTWTLTITPAGEGSVDVTLAAGTVTDQVDLTNEEGSFSITADYASPTVVIAAPVSEAKVNGPFQITVEFSEPVTGFEATDIDCRGGVASNVTGNGAIYTVDITPNDGATRVRPQVLPNTVTDLVGKTNTGSSRATYHTDYVVPFVKTISVPDYANATFTATITFNEEIEGFDLSDIVITNASAANLSGSGAVYTVDITPITDGNITIDIPEGAVQDPAGNDNVASTQKTVIADFTAPTLTVEAPEYVNGTAIVTLTFSEDVTGLVQSDMVVENGTVTGFTGSGSVYTARYFSDDEAEMIISFPEGIGQDAVGNLTLAGPNKTIIVDYTAPLFTISHPEAVSGPFTATITFTEPVTGFELSDLTTTNANISNLLGSDAVYTVDVVPTKENFMFLNLSSGKAFDLAGNGNSETIEQYIPVDFTTPTVDISVPAVTNGAFSATFTFSEEMADFESSDVTLSNATIANLSGDGTIFTADITPVSEGNVTLDIAAAAVQDIAGNDNEAAGQKTVSVDVTAPEVTITASDLENGNFVANINFSESIIGFESSDITLTNGMVGSLTGSDANYSVEILPLDEGNVTIDIAAGVVTDAAGNGNTAAEQSTTLVDVTEPVITIIGSEVTDHTITYTFAFSEEVTGFELADLSVENGVLSNFNSSGDTYTIDVAGDGLGLMKLTVAAAAVLDLAGNGNEEVVAENDLGYELAPVFISTPTTSTDNSFSSYYSYVIEVTDANGDDIDISAPVLPDWLSLDNIYTVSTAHQGIRLRGIAIDSQDNIYIANDVAGQIIKFDTEGNQTVFVGSGSGFTDGTGTDAAFYFPKRMAVDSEDNLYVVDQSGKAIRKITPSGEVSTLAGNNLGGYEDGTGTDAGFTSIGDIAVDNDSGNIYVISSYGGTSALRRISSEGEVTTLTSTASGEGVAVDNQGNIFYMNDSYELIKRSTDGTETVVAGNGYRGSESIQYIDGTGTEARFASIYGMAVDSDNNLFLSDYGLLRRVTPEGVVTTLAGNPASRGNSNGVGSNARFQWQFDIVIASSGVIYVGDDFNNRIRKLTAETALLGWANEQSGDYDVRLEATDGVNAPVSQVFTISVTDVTAEILSFEIFSIEEPHFAYIDEGNVAFEGYPVQYALNYNKLVNVTGEPYVEMSLAGERLIYKSGSGSDRLIFEWTATADLNNNLPVTYSGTDALKLNGGSIKDINGTDMPTTLGNEFDSFYRAGTWAVKSITTTAENGTYGIGDEIGFIVEFESDSDLLSVDATYDDAAIKLNIQNDNGEVNQYYSDYEEGPGPNQVIITVTVEEGDYSADLDFVRYEVGDDFGYDANGAAYLYSYYYQDEYGFDFDGIFEFTNPDLNHSIAAVKDIVIDGVRPTVDISFDNSIGTSFVATLTFSEEVSGLELSDLVVGNGLASNLSGSGKVYTVDIVPTALGAVTLDMGAELVIDVAGNGNVAASQASALAVSDSDNFNTTLTAVYDLGNAGYINATSGGTATIRFDRDVTGFEQSDIVTTNLNITSFITISGSEYQVDFEAVAEGTAYMGVPAHVATDGAAGNGATTQLSMTADVTAPGVTIVADALVNEAFTATITFDESVTGFELSDIVVGNGSASNLSGSGANYTADITPTTDGDVTLDIAAAVAQDVAENNNTIADQVTVSADLTAPDVTIAADALVNGVFTATITFDESVTGFELSDITVGNGAVANLVGSDANYTVDVTPATDGNVTLDIAGGVVLDEAGNANRTADGLSVMADLTAPTIAITTSAAESINATSTYTFTFSESVTGFELSDIVVGNGTAANISGSGSVYTAEITPSTDGVMTVDIPAGIVQDMAGNDNLVANQLTRLVDLTGPEVTITSTINGGSYDLTITLTEEATDFYSSKLRATGGTISNFSGSGTAYTATLTPSTTGNVSVYVSVNWIHDELGNGNTATGEHTIPVNFFTPDMRLVSASDLSGTIDQGDNTLISPIYLYLTFPTLRDDLRLDVDLSDFEIINASISDIYFYGNSLGYRLKITPDKIGDVSINLPAGTITDPFTSSTNAAVSTNYVFTAHPQVTVTVEDQKGAANGYAYETFLATFSFDQEVSGFIAKDITVNNGIKGAFAEVDADTYTLEITPNSEGAVTINVAEGKAQNEFGYSNVAADQLSLTYDKSLEAIISSTVGTGTGTSPIPFTITFNETVTDFDISDISVVNGTISNFAGSGDVYTTEVVPVVEGDVVLTVASLAATNSAGNKNINESSKTVEYRTTGPSIESFYRLSEGIVGWWGLTARVKFDEEVTGLTIDDVIVSNGTVTRIVRASLSQPLWDINISPDSDGTMTLQIAAGSVINEFGISNEAASETISAEADLSVATPVFDVIEDTDPDNPEYVRVNVTFDEDVYGYFFEDKEGSGYGLSITNATFITSSYIEDGEPFQEEHYIIIAPLNPGEVTITFPEYSWEDELENYNEETVEFSFDYGEIHVEVPVITGISDDTGSSDNDGITSDKRITIHGTAEPNAEVEVFSQFGLFRKVQADANGDWVVDNTHQDLFELVVNLTAEAIDLAGNRSETSDVFVLTPDFTAPAKPVITGISNDTGSSDSDGITNDKRITIHGTAEPFAQVGVYSQFGLFSNVQADGNGDWVIDNTHQDLFEIAVNLTAKAVDLAGNQSAVSDVFVLTPDFTAPAKPVITGISDDTGSSDSDGITNDKRITIHGTAEPFAHVDVYSQYGLFSSVQADGNGDWVIDNTHQDLFEIVVNLTAKAVDLAGNQSIASDVFVLTPDFTAPAKPVITGISDDTGSSDSDGITNDKRITIHGTAEPFAHVDVYSQYGLFSSVQADGNGDWVINNTHQDLFEIVVNLTAKAVDLAGNQSAASDVFVLTPDFTAPAKPVITGISDDTGSSNSDGITNDKRITIHGTAEPFAQVDVYSQYGLFSSIQADGNGDWVIDNTHQDLFEIVVNLTAKAVDLAGNQSVASDVFVLAPDFTAPAKPVITGISDDTGSSNSDGITNDKRITIHGTAEPFTHVDVYSQYGLFSSVQADGNGDWVVDNTHQDLFEIVVNLTAKAVDLAGNQSIASDVFVLTPDFTAPAKPVIMSISDDTGSSDSDGITNDKRITIHGTAEPFAKVEVFSQYGFFNSIEADANGDWVIDNTHQDLFEIVVNLTAEAVDLAGNRSTTSDVFVLTPDFTKPEVTISVEGNTSEVYTIVAEFNEEVSGLTLDGVTVTGGTASVLTQQSPTTYSFLVTSSGAVTDVTINADAAQDVAGNSSRASNQLTLNPTPVSNGEVLINTLDFIEPEARLVVNVYPNPASKWLTIDLSAINAESVDVAIVSLSGKNVLGLQGFEKKELKVDVSGYDNGLYLVLVSTGKEVIKKKVLVKK